jgi:hypothetical protein
VSGRLLVYPMNVSNAFSRDMQIKDADDFVYIEGTSKRDIVLQNR